MTVDSRLLIPLPNPALGATFHGTCLIHMLHGASVATGIDFMPILPAIVGPDTAVASRARPEWRLR